MIAALWVLSLWTGTTKAVSVCGVNSALAARAYARTRRFPLLVYFVGLAVGTSILVTALSSLGWTFANSFGASRHERALLFAMALVALGAYEAVNGPGALPHIAWAVPRNWVCSVRTLGLFGVVRGLAIFNHSPFASMHAWALALILVPEYFPPLLTAATLAGGLALWTVVHWLAALTGGVTAEIVADGLSDQFLVRTPTIARIDGLALIVCGAVVLALTVASLV